jgi:2-polyprenyl-6-methoxyphenol hydroxylase-like FAD-dependent oxidoreductase
MANTPAPLSIAIVGAGMGGLTAASTLRLFGFDVQVYEQVLPDEIIHRGKKVVGLDERGSRVTLRFEDGDEADAVIGADGVHSIVRDLTSDPMRPFTRDVSRTERCFLPR